MVFFENATNQIDIRQGRSSYLVLTGSGIYDFSVTKINNTPLYGVTTVTNNVATLPIQVTTAFKYNLWVRTNTFPSSYAKISINPDA